MALKAPTKHQFAILFRRTHRDVFRFAAWLTSGDVAWAEDITAATYERAWERRDDVAGQPGNSLPWLLAIARNCFVDEYRSAKRSSVVDPDDLRTLKSPQHNPEHEQIRREDAQLLWNLISRLPVEQREILVLRYVFEWKIKDIAKYTNKKPNTVSVALRRILADLGDLWSEV